jgi:hypothetical protein
VLLVLVERKAEPRASISAQTRGKVTAKRMRRSTDADLAIARADQVAIAAYSGARTQNSGLFSREASGATLAGTTVE